MNRGFADLRVEPLHHVARDRTRLAAECVAGCPSRIRTSVHGSKVRCPTTRRRGSGPQGEEWSGRRDSNPRPSPWQGDALPTEPLPLEDPTTFLGWCREPGSNWRHRDFQSRALPTELSRPEGQPAVGCPSAGRRIPRASPDHQRAGRLAAHRAADRSGRVPGAPLAPDGLPGWSACRCHKVGLPPCWGGKQTASTNGRALIPCPCRKKHDASSRLGGPRVHELLCGQDFASPPRSAGADRSFACTGGKSAGARAVRAARPPAHRAPQFR